MSHKTESGMLEVESLLAERYGVTIEDCSDHVERDAIERDLLNGEEPSAIVDYIACDCGLTKVAAPESKETRALRIAMLGKRAEFDIYGNRINPNENLGPVVTDDGEGWDDGDDDNDM